MLQGVLAGWPKYTIAVRRAAVNVCASSRVPKASSGVGLFLVDKIGNAIGTSLCTAAIVRQTMVQ